MRLPVELPGLLARQLWRENKMNQQYFDSNTKAGTAGGTLLTILANINSEDLLKTVILAALGAAVSFSVTLLLKLLIKRLKK